MSTYCLFDPENYSKDNQTKLTSGGLTNLNLIEKIWKTIVSNYFARLPGITIFVECLLPSLVFTANLFVPIFMGVIFVIEPLDPLRRFLQQIFAVYELENAILLWISWFLSQSF